MKSAWAFGAAAVAVLLAAVVIATLATGMGTAARLSPAEALDGVDVPSVGTVGDYPDPERRVVVDVTAGGTIVVDGTALTFEQLGAELKRRGAMAPGEPLAGVPGRRLSDAPVVLRVDGSLPWGATRMLVQACADAMTWRVFLAVRHEGDDEEGAVALFLPRDRGVLCGDDSIVGRRVRLLPGPGPASPDAVFRELQRSPAALTGKLAVTVDADARALTRQAVSLVDASLRAGAKGVAIAVGRRITWADAVRSDGLLGGGCSVEVDGKPLADGGAEPMPAVARVRGAFAGVTDPAIGASEPEPEPEPVERTPAPSRR